LRGAAFLAATARLAEGFLAAGRFAPDPDAVEAQRAADDNLDHETPLSEVFEDQIACADIVLLTKADLAGSAGLEAAKAAIEAEMPRRVPMLIGLVFGIVALFLAAVGIYGVLAYQVSQRRREIGIRMALGSSTRSILGLVVRDGMQITGIGLAVGLVGLVGLTRVIRGMLYGVQPADPMVIALVAIVLAGVALVATLIPARRAARVSPMSALNE